MHAECLNWGEAGPPEGERLRVTQALRAGALIAIPTETVYGLAARADSQAAIESLVRLKGSPSGRAFTWHVASSAALDLFQAQGPPVAQARRLARRYWPGPLTLVLEGVPKGLELVAQAGWTGVRCPAHPATLRLIQGLEFPLVATSANLAGQRELPDAASIMAQFSKELAFVIDGQGPKLGEASTVLQLGHGQFRVLRTGIIDLLALRRAAGLALAFVCTGNTCRSPMAEGLARVALAQRLQTEPSKLGEFGFQLASMGLAALPGDPASEHSVAVLGKHGIDLSEHHASIATSESLAAFDHIYAMTSRHLQALRSLLAASKHGALELLDPTGADLVDPIGGPRSAYLATAAQIERALAVRVRDWA